jgi:hypothetical protein
MNHNLVVVDVIDAYDEYSRKDFPVRAYGFVQGSIFEDDELRQWIRVRGEEIIKERSKIRKQMETNPNAYDGEGTALTELLFDSKHGLRDYSFAKDVNSVISNVVISSYATYKAQAKLLSQMNPLNEQYRVLCEPMSLGNHVVLSTKDDEYVLPQRSGEVAASENEICGVAGGHNLKTIIGDLFVPLISTYNELFEEVGIKKDEIINDKVRVLGLVRDRQGPSDKYSQKNPPLSGTSWDPALSFYVPTALEAGEIKEKFVEIKERTKKERKRFKYENSAVFFIPKEDLPTFFKGELKKDSQGRVLPDVQINGNSLGTLVHYNHSTKNDNMTEQTIQDLFHKGVIVNKGYSLKEINSQHNLEINLKQLLGID